MSPGYRFLAVFIMITISGCSWTNVFRNSEANRREIVERLKAEEYTDDSKFVSLDGKSFKCEMTERMKGWHWLGPPVMNNVITFHVGKLYSNIAHAYGFKAASYKAVTDGQRTYFVSEAVDSTQGRFFWSGSIYRDRLSASATWQRLGEDILEYTTSGRLDNDGDYSWNIEYDLR